MFPAGRPFLSTETHLPAGTHAARPEPQGLLAGLERLAHPRSPSRRANGRRRSVAPGCDRSSSQAPCSAQRHRKTLLVVATSLLRWPARVQRAERNYPPTQSTPLRCAAASRRRTAQQQRHPPKKITLLRPRRTHSESFQIWSAALSSLMLPP